MVRPMNSRAASRRLLIAAAALLLAACARPATVGLNTKATTIPADAATTCASYCTTMGLTLDSVVLMADNIGCVCSARAKDGAAGAPGESGAPGATGAPGTTGAAGGMAALMLQEAAAQRSRSSQRQSYRAPPPVR